MRSPSIKIKYAGLLRKSNCRTWHKRKDDNLDHFIETGKIAGFERHWDASHCPETAGTCHLGYFLAFQPRSPGGLESMKLQWCVHG